MHMLMIKDFHLPFRAGTIMWDRLLFSIIVYDRASKYTKFGEHFNLDTVHVYGEFDLILWPQGHSLQ